MPDLYATQVSYLNYQLLGDHQTNVVEGTTRNDFFNLLGGDDAVDAGGGDDVLDGGTGSNFLTGATGRDVFFLDGRRSAGGSPGQSTWSTITDWGAGEELAIWGWQTGISTRSWLEFDGAVGWEGATLHADLNGDGTIDTSVTWTGITQSELPIPIEFPDLLWFQSPTVV